MRFRRNILAVVLSALVILTVPPSFAKEVASTTLEEKVREFDLENGMKFLVVERHEAPVVFCAIAVNVGSTCERPNITGISHLLEHMMFKGTKMIGTTDYEAEVPYLQKTDELGERTIQLRKKIGEWRFRIFKDFAKQIVNSFSDEERKDVGTDKYKENRLLVEKIRAMKSLPDSLTSRPYLIEDQGEDYLQMFLDYESAKGEIAHLLDEQRRYIKKDQLWETYMNNGARFLNAGTAEDFTIYFVYLPANRLELWMTMESDRMDSPVFREFWSERDVVMEERRLGENDPDDSFSEAFMSVAFTASPYNWPIVGWMSDLLTINRKELEDYHRIYYAPNNSVAIIVGDVELNKVKEMARKYFEPIPAQAPPPPVETREPEQRGERRLVIEHTANPKLMIGYHKPVYPHPDSYALDVLSYILAEGRTSRLYKTVYEERQLTAEAPSAYAGPGQRYDNLLIIEAEPRNPHTLEEVEQAIYEEIEKLKAEPVSDRELQRVKNMLDAMLIRQLASNTGIAFQVGMGEVFYGDYHATFKSLERTKAVMPEDVMRVAKKYLTRRNRTVGYRIKVDEKASGEESEQEIDRQELMKYIGSLSSEERAAIMQRFQSLKNDVERRQFARELWKRYKASQTGGKTEE